MFEKYLNRLFTLAPHLSESDKEFYFNYFLNTGFVEIVFLDEYDLSVPFKKYYKSKDYDNFIYDKTVGAVILQLSAGYHELTLARLYEFYDLAVDKKLVDKQFVYQNNLSTSKSAEQFIDSNLGFFMSSVSRHINISKSYEMTKREKQFFDNFKFREI